MSLSTRIFACILGAIFALSATSTEAVVVKQKQTRKHKKSCSSSSGCTTSQKSHCTDLKQPPLVPNDQNPEMFEGENCVCCFQQFPKKVCNRNLNCNEPCQAYCELCKTYGTPINYPTINFPDELNLVPNPPIDVPPCQQIVNPPEVDPSIALSVVGKNVLVIGASKGIGKAVAEKFAAEGANVIGTSRHPKCYEKPEGYRLLQLDIRIENDVKEFVNKVAQHYFNGKIDILVNSAAIWWHGPAAEATGDEMMNYLQIKLGGYQRTVHYSLPYMRHSNETRVISIGSNSGYVFIPNVDGIYSMSNRALQMWNDTLQAEEMYRKAHGTGSVPPKGPTFSLVEPNGISTSVGLYEAAQANALSTKDPLIVGAKIVAAALVFSGPDFAPAPSFAADTIFNIVIAPQPGVRYSSSTANAEVTIPSGPLAGTYPLLEAIQLINSLSPTDALNLGMIPFSLNFFADNNMEQIRQQIDAIACPDSSTPQDARKRIAKAKMKANAVNIKNLGLGFH